MLTIAFLSDILRKKDRETKMANIYSKIDELVGKTPLLRLSNIEKAHGLKATLLA